MSVFLESTALRIRDGIAADAPLLTQKMAEWFLTAYGHVSDATNTAVFVAENFQVARQIAELADPDIHTLIAETDAGLAGYTQLRFAKTAPECVDRANTAELGRFYVDPLHHGRGVAQQLMRAAFAATRARQRDWLWLMAWQQAPQAIRFYEKQGFEKVGPAIFKVGADEQHDWVMRAPVP
jgi:ribosomal protein S18 acetylase RimI-like enzyme